MTFQTMVFLFTFTLHVCFLLLYVNGFLLSSFMSSSIKTNNIKDNRNNKNNEHNLHYAKPKRFEDNADGILYVNDDCINCAACSYFAPNTFDRSTVLHQNHHIVYKQPPTNDTTSLDFINARIALAACPVSAIRTLTKGEVSHYNKVIVKNEQSSNQSRNLLLLPELTPQEEITSKAYSSTSNQYNQHLPLPFPLRLSNNVWLLGHHSSKSFGAFPYFVKGYHKGKNVSIIVDVPKYTPSAVRAISSLLEQNQQDAKHNNDEERVVSVVDYMFLTHVDDTAQHNDWKNEYPTLKRIFHSGDLGRHNWIGDTSLEQVEVLLDENNVFDNGKTIITMKVYSLDGHHHFDLDLRELNEEELNERITNLMIEIDSDFLILHTPGHSQGSISLLFNSQRRLNSDFDGGTIFTGDTYAYSTRNGGHMSGFPRYGYDLAMQTSTLKFIGQLSNTFDCVAPGHGHVRNYRTMDSSQVYEMKQKDIADAVDELLDFAGRKASR